MSRSEEFHSASTAHLQEGKHRSQGPIGSVIYNPTGKKTGPAGKHARHYASYAKTYNIAGKHSAGYTGKHR